MMRRHWEYPLTKRDKLDRVIFISQQGVKLSEKAASESTETLKQELRRLKKQLDEVQRRLDESEDSRMRLQARMGELQDYRELVGTWCYNNGRSRYIVKKSDRLQFVQDGVPEHGTVQGELITTLDDGVEWSVASLPHGAIRLRQINDAVLSQFKFRGETRWGYDNLATQAAGCNSTTCGGVKDMRPSCECSAEQLLEASKRDVHQRLGGVPTPMRSPVKRQSRCRDSPVYDSTPSTGVPALLLTDSPTTASLRNAVADVQAAPVPMAVVASTFCRVPRLQLADMPCIVSPRCGLPTPTLTTAAPPARPVSRTSRSVTPSASPRLVTPRSAFAESTLAAELAKAEAELLAHAAVVAKVAAPALNTSGAAPVAVATRAERSACSPAHDAFTARPQRGRSLQRLGAVLHCTATALRGLSVGCARV